jgi:hypothetical protein
MGCPLRSCSCSFSTADLVAAKAAGHTAQLAAAIGLLAWLLAARGPRWWRASVWTAAASSVAVCAGCWVYLGWTRTSEAVTAVLIGAAAASDGTYRWAFWQRRIPSSSAGRSA